MFSTLLLELSVLSTYALVRTSPGALWDCVPTLSSYRTVHLIHPATRETPPCVCNETATPGSRGLLGHGHLTKTHQNQSLSPDLRK